MRPISLMAILLLIAACSHNSDSAPAAPSAPLQPCACDAGPDRDLVLSQTVGYPTTVEVGTPAVAGLSYAWLPADSVDDATKAQPLASPTIPQQYQVTVSGPSCATASCTMNVYVFQN